ncbi:hypothetical protein CAPTEDRAFT_219556 [Capitella teleta]|uniref:G-protein coupled receptors family 1 profile domain-containing protein n=1 Tax=Capitella teleta TaxID=283909 RepID=R7VFE3_CAPTE|nr:hypothetical protein CAPTEDRAFT_219556 [Capitella teleta]|eukprot:ELU17334.1 hypothetical protein CAPTEDRAFT_219556 [Capitella teleta]
MADDEQAMEENLYAIRDGHWKCQIQYAGVAASGVTVLAHITLITYLNMHSVGAAAGLSPGKWPLTERCFLHMALINSLFGCGQLLDLLRICAMQSTAPSTECKGFAVVFHARVISECQMAVIAVCLACVLYSKSRPLNLGSYQWRLFVPMDLLPVCLSVSLMFVPDLMGHGGPWCFISIHSDLGLVYTRALVCVICVLWVGCLVTSVVIVCLVSKRRKESAIGEVGLNALRTAESLLVFVPLSFVNLFILILALAWSVYDNLPHDLELAVVTISNLHGVFYCFAYGLIQRYCTIITLPTPKKPSAGLQLQELNSMESARERGVMNIHESMARLDARQLEAEQRTVEREASPGRSSDANQAFTNLHYVEDIEI